MLRLLVAALLVALIALQVQLWQQYREVRALQQAVTAQQEQNQVLHKRNHELAAEVDDLRAGQEAINERARTELGLIGQGEQFIQIIEQPETAANRQPQDADNGADDNRS